MFAESFFNSLGLLIIGAFLTGLSAWFWFTRREAVDKAASLAKDHAKTIDRLTEVETKLALVSAAVVPISTAFQAILIKELTHDETPELDALLKKVGPPNILTKMEEARLKALLLERTLDPDYPDHEQDAARILPVVMKRALADEKRAQTEQSGSSTDQVQVVSTPGDPLLKSGGGNPVDAKKAEEQEK